MGRKPEGKVARTVQVMVRLTPDGLAEVDRLRQLDGGLPRSAYFRRLLALDAKRRPEK